MLASQLDAEYPKAITLMDGTKTALRPLSSDDEARLLRFFMRVPEADRYFLKEDVTDPALIHRWASHIDLDRVIAIVAILGDEIIADATLHRSRDLARSRVGEYRLVVDPAYRGLGLAGRLAEEMLDMAADIGLRKVVYEAVDPQEEIAIKATKRIGFEHVATLKGRVVDLWGREQDLVILERAIGASDTKSYSSAGRQTETTADELSLPAIWSAVTSDVEPDPNANGSYDSDGVGHPLDISSAAEDDATPAGGATKKLTDGHEEPCQGSLIVRLDSGGDGQATMRLLNEIGVHQELRLLEMVGGLRDACVLLKLRAPVRVLVLFSAMTGVSDVRRLPDPTVGGDDHVIQVVLRSSGEPVKVTVQAPRSRTPMLCPPSYGRVTSAMN